MNLGSMRIDEHSRPIKSPFKQVAREHASNRAFLVAGAHKRDSFGSEQGVEIACRHGLSSGPVDALVNVRPIAPSQITCVTSTRLMRVKD
jgi:hypothetical protein